MLDVPYFFPNFMTGNLIISAYVKWIFIILIILYIFHRQFKQQLRTLRLLYRLPQLPGHPILGQTIWLLDLKRCIECRPAFRKLYGPVLKVWNFFFPMVLITDPEDVQKILASSKHLQKPFYYSFFKNVIGDGLIINEVPKWRIHRRLLQPYFRMKCIEEHLPNYNKGSLILNEALEQHLENATEINITSLLNKIVLCILSESIFGLDLNPKTALTDIGSLPFRQSSNKFIDRIFKPLFGFDFIYNRTKQAQKDTNTANFRMNFTKNLIKERREMRQKGLIKNKCFLDFLLDISENEAITEEDCIKEACSLVLAGQDSVATTLAFCLHQIANNTEVQEKITNELELILGDSERDLTASDVRQMIYLEQCIKETMRIYPALPIIVRTLGEDVTLGKYEIPKGCSVLIAPWFTHFLDKFYTDPEKFNPSRFEPAEGGKKHPYAFLSFSAGPRNCIGAKFAMVEMKTIIANILRKYSIAPVPGKENLNIKYKVTLRASGGVWLTLSSKKKQQKA